MTENTSETQIPTRSQTLQARVMSLISETFDRLYADFDKLEKQGVSSSEIVEALREIGEEEIRENYAAWANVDIRDEDPRTLDPVVPDPHDAPSYESVEIIPPVQLEVHHRFESFTGWELLRLIIDEFPLSYVDQTGGGTATFVIRKESGDIPITAGPGSYNWTTPKSSEFYTNEFYWGPDTYGVEGEEPVHQYVNEPGEALDFENPGTLEQLAERIRATYAKYNAPKES